MRNSRHLKSNTRRGRISRRARRGVLAVLAVFVLVGAFAFVAFAVDTGLIVLTQTKMQNAADAVSTRPPDANISAKTVATQRLMRIRSRSPMRARWLSK